MKNHSLIIAFLLTALIFTVIGLQFGIWKGRILGYEEANSQINNKQHELTMQNIDYKFELNRCRQWAIWKVNKRG